MAKVKVASVEVKAGVANTIARNLLGLGGLKDLEDRKTRKRIIAELQKSKYYTEDMKKCEECGTEHIYFLLKEKADGEELDPKILDRPLLFLFTRAERKFLFDKVIEPIMKQDPPAFQRKLLREMAGNLGAKWLDAFEALIEKEEPDEMKPEDLEVISADEDDEEPKPEPKEPEKANA